MSKSRYFTALGVAIVVFVVATIFFESLYFDEERYVLAYLLAALVAELIFGEAGLAGRVFLFFISWIPSIAAFWISLFSSGLIGFIISLAIFSFCFGAIGVILLVAIGLALLISAVLFIVHVFTFARDLY